MTERLPKSYQQITDIINFLQRAHAEMRTLCTTAGATLGETKTGLLLKTLADRQKNMVEFLETSRSGADEKILSTWIQFVPNEQIEKRLDTTQAEKVHPEKLPEHLLQLQNEIAEFIEVPQDETASSDVEEFLQSLADRELAEAKLSAEVVLEQNDI